jgi:hypothetical protein
LSPPSLLFVFTGLEEDVSFEVFRQRVRRSSRESKIRRHFRTVGSPFRV